MLEFPATARWKTGLSEAEAQARLKAEGYNELPRPDRRTALRIVLEVLREPMLALLIAGGVVYLALGDWREALILLVFANLSIVITVVSGNAHRTGSRGAAGPDESARAGHSRRRAQTDSRPGSGARRRGRACRRRSCSRRRCARRMRRPAGRRIAADRRVCARAKDRQARASNRTRRSTRRRRLALCLFRIAGRSGRRNRGSRRHGSDERNRQDRPIAQLAGNRAPASANANEPTGADIRRGWRRRHILAVVLYGMLRGHWLDALLGGIALGMSMLPEEFPVVLAVFMAMGAWRISRARVLTRRAAAIETLGSATVLCTDKTGTLTENRMTITELRAADGRAFRLDGSADPSIPDAFQDLIEVGVLASAREPFDPMEKAFHALRRKSAPAPRAPGQRRPRVCPRLRAAARSPCRYASLEAGVGRLQARRRLERRARSHRGALPP